MKQTLRQLYDLCDRTLKLQLAQLFALVLLMAALEIISIGLFLPLIQVLIDPSRLSALPVVGSWLAPLVERDQSELVALFGVGVVGVFAAKNLIMAVVVLQQNRVIFLAQADLQARLLLSYVRRPYLFHLQKNSAEFVRTIMVSASVAFAGVFLPLLGIVTEGILGLAAVCVLVVVEPVGALATVAGLALALALIYALVQRPLLQMGRRIESHTQSMFQSLNQTFGAYKELVLLHRAEHFTGAFAVVADTRGRDGAARATLQQVPRLVIEVMVLAALVMVILVVAYRSGSLEAALPVIGIFAAAGMRILPSVNRILQHLANVRGNAAAVESVHKGFFEDAVSVCAPAKAATDPSPSGEIRFDAVDFTYPDRTGPALLGISFMAQRGERIGVVGSSGAGKSTLADVLLGLLIPERGTVRVDGADIQEDIANWQLRVGYVPQSIYICDDTLRRNVALAIGDEAIDEAALHRAIRLAQLDTLVDELPHGFDTMLGERGQRLSGGQRQRIGIARALYHDPAVIVFDEATSALDNETEQAIARTIDELAGAKTFFIIAHRVETMRKCDRLLYLKEGRIADIGSFDDLRRRSDDFRRMTQSLGGEGSVVAIAQARSIA